MNSICGVLLSALLSFQFISYVAVDSPNQLNAAHPIKMENKWDYQNQYPEDFIHPSYVLDIPSNPFSVTPQPPENYTVDPWIITGGFMSDTTTLSDMWVVTNYDDKNYIQVGIEVNYGVQNHKTPSMVTPWYIDCMLIYAFDNAEVENCNGKLAIINKQYESSKLKDLIIYSDSDITVYDVLSLVSKNSFEENLSEFLNTTGKGYKEGFTYDFIQMLEYKNYLIKAVPLNIKKNTTNTITSNANQNPNTGKY